MVAIDKQPITDIKDHSGEELCECVFVLGFGMCVRERDCVRVRVCVREWL